MQYETTQAFVLHSRPFKESSLILHCFTQEFGMISVLAKGLKRKNAQAKRAILQPFNRLVIRFTGKGELKTLCDSELVEYTEQPGGNALACCYYLNELILRSLKEWQEQEELFKTYAEVIQYLKNCEKKDLPKILRSFEISLITFLGLSPNWQCDIDDCLIDEAHYYEYVIDTGFRKLDACHLESVNDALSPNRFSGKTIVAIEQNNFSNINLKECQKLTQKLIRPLIGNRTLESRKMWLQ